MLLFLIDFCSHIKSLPFSDFLTIMFHFVSIVCVCCCVFRLCTFACVYCAKFSATTDVKFLDMASNLQTLQMWVIFVMSACSEQIFGNGLLELQISWQQNPECRQTKLYINGPNPGLARFTLGLKEAGFMPAYRTTHWTCLS